MFALRAACGRDARGPCQLSLTNALTRLNSLGHNGDRPFRPFFSGLSENHFSTESLKLASMPEKIGRIRLLYIVLAVLLVVGLLPLAFAGTVLSSRSADELRSVEGRYQAQLVQDKARQIELTDSDTAMS